MLPGCSGLVWMICTSFLSRICTTVCRSSTTGHNGRSGSRPCSVWCEGEVNLARKKRGAISIGCESRRPSSFENNEDVHLVGWSCNVAAPGWRCWTRVGGGSEWEGRPRGRLVVGSLFLGGHLGVKRAEEDPVWLSHRIYLRWYHDLGIFYFVYYVTMYAPGATQSG